jgi:hypothetical protein
VKADELELITVKKMHLHVELVLVHLAIENQLIRSRALEGEPSAPVPVMGVGDPKRFVGDVDRGNSWRLQRSNLHLRGTQAVLATLG